MNDARFTGNVTRTPEAKAMSNGKLRCVFTLAVQRPYSTPKGERLADFINFVAYEKNAEIAQKYLSKGRKALIVSHVKTGNYEKDGKRIFTTEFVVDKIEFLSSPQQDKGDQQNEIDTDSSFLESMQSPYDDNLPF